MTLETPLRGVKLGEWVELRRGKCDPRGEDRSLNCRAVFEAGLHAGNETIFQTSGWVRLPAEFKHIT